MKSMIYNWRKW